MSVLDVFFSAPSDLNKLYVRVGRVCMASRMAWHARALVGWVGWFGRLVCAFSGTACYPITQPITRTVAMCVCESAHDLYGSQFQGAVSMVERRGAGGSEMGEM